MSRTNLPGTVGDATLASIALPEGVTLTAVPWDDAESAELRTIQQAEIAVRYADPDADEVPTTSDIGRPPSADEIVVCGRPVQGGGGYRVPWAPEPGARVRLIAGEPPSATGAMGAGGCLRLCEQPVMLNLLDPGSIARGLDRILGGD